MHFTKPLLVLLVCSAVACSDNNSALTDQEKSSVTDTIRQTLDRYYADIKKGGLTAEFPYLDSSADFFWVPPGYGTPLSYDTVHAILVRNAAMFRSIDNSWESLSIHPLTRELASYTGKIRSAVTDTSGKSFNSSLIETGILIRRKSGWKLLSGQTSMTELK